MSYISSFRQASFIGALMLTAGLASGCATTHDTPTSAMQAARLAIANAEEAGAAREASFELNRARDKYDAAEDAVENNNNLQGERLAEEATVLAELAYSRSEMLAAKRINDELQQTTEMFKEELNRQTRDSQTGGRS